MRGQALLWHMARAAGATWLIVSVLFLLSHATIDPESQLRDTLENATHPSEAGQRAAATQQLLHRYGLDTPLFYTTWHPQVGWQWHGGQNQYHAWLTQLAHGNLGYSYQADAPVAELLAQALHYTLPLTLLAALLSVSAAVGLTVVLSYRPVGRRWFLRLAHTLQSLPLFLLALGLLLLFANPDALSWFPAFGLSSTAAAEAWQQPGIMLYQLTLPVASLVLSSFPALAIQLDGALQQEFTQPYTATARAKGASQARTAWRHALRNALLPLVTLLTELLPSIVAGSVVVEVIFALPGMGRLIADAALQQDFPVLLGGVGLVAFVRLVAQFMADILYSVLDPRFRIAA
ncbi:ABC transporter permease [Hymenobacter endophyticus]|uniref:ABC transporter permease n=1 Tax=Hymenobacter endophyticus TaxID=3076335 RepID=A0ABU3TD10_9BACT|nr:ABC transporter permease [Hymenobacter endophyticus]MDU0369224.1 ABC transporter permease [Hymenobacter endophyticus]